MNETYTPKEVALAYSSEMDIVVRFYKLFDVTGIKGDVSDEMVVDFFNISATVFGITRAQFERALGIRLHLENKRHEYLDRVHSLS